jgi:glycine oxidase
MPKDNIRKRILVVGGGLAGSFFAATSLKEGHVVDLVDHRHPKSASRIAAGMYNIVTGKKAVLTWRAEEFMENFNAFFDTEPFRALAQYLHKVPIYRPYHADEVQKEWGGLSQSPPFAGWVKHQDHPMPDMGFKDPRGGLLILPCGWLDTIRFLDHLQDILSRDFPCRVFREPFIHSEFDPNSITWKNEPPYHQVVFAEGTENRHNPWFNYVDVHPLKGQIMEFRTTSNLKDMVLLRKSYMIPNGDGTFVCGSTYEHHFEDLEPDEEGVNTLKNHAEQALNQSVEILNARAGERPSTRDRRPILGRHPIHEKLFFLNGLGTKGVLLAPTCAQWVLNLMNGDEEAIPKEARIERYLSSFKAH